MYKSSRFIIVFVSNIEVNDKNKHQTDGVRYHNTKHYLWMDEWNVHNGKLREKERHG